MKIYSSLASDGTREVSGLNNDKTFSEEKAKLSALLLLKKASSIIGAVAHEANYVDCCLPTGLHRELMELIRDIELSCRTLKGSSEFLPLRGRKDSNARRDIICMDILRTLGGLALANSKLILYGVKRPEIIKASFLVTRSAALVSRAVEVYRYRQTIEGDLVKRYRYCTDSLVQGPGCVFPRVAMLVNALADALDTIIVAWGETEASQMEKEALLCSFGAFACASRCISEDIVQQQNSYSFLGVAASGTQLETRYRNLIVTVLQKALKQVDYVIAYIQYHNSEAANSYQKTSFKMASQVIEVFISEIELQRQNAPNAQILVQHDVCVVLYGMLSCICCMRLMHSICKKHGLEEHEYAKSVDNALSLAGDMLKISSDKFDDRSGKTTKSSYLFILSSLEVAQENLHKHSIPSPLDKEQFSYLTRRARDAINMVCAMCAESIKQIEGIKNEGGVPNSSNADVSVRSVLNTRRGRNV